MAATFADYIFKCILVDERFCASIQISLKFVPKVPADNKGDKPLPEPMLTEFTDVHMRH